STASNRLSACLPPHLAGGDRQPLPCPVEMRPVMSPSPSPDTRQATEPKYAVSARLVTIRNVSESLLISITPQPTQSVVAAAAFSESDNAGTLTQVCFSPR